MPQIKFSSLVTDMKGKANGSVFSSNRQGAYMRTNKSGGGKKSLSWENSKSRLAFLSTQWKALTLEQREQWNTIAPSYPALNKFNEPYNPSGYQVFMRLNGTLFAQGLPLLSVPNPPRSTPEINEISVYCPENFCYTPSRVAYVGKLPSFAIEKGASFVSESDVTPVYDSEISASLVSRNLLTSVPTLNNTSFGVRFIPRANFNGLFAKDKLVPLFGLYDNEDFQINCALQIINSKESYLMFAFYFPGDDDDKFVSIQYSIISNSLLKSSFHFGLQLHTVLLENSKVFINGINIQLSDPKYYLEPDHNPFYYVSHPDDNVPRPDINPEFSSNTNVLIGFPSDSFINPYNVSDFRFISADNQPDTECESHEDCSGFAQCYMGICVDGPDLNVPCVDWQFNLLSYGYVLGYESVIVGFNNFSFNEFSADFTSVGKVAFSYVVNESQAQRKLDTSNDMVGSLVCVSNSFTYVPLVYLQSVETLDSDWFIQSLCSGTLSAGKIETQVPFKQLMCIPTNSESVCLSPALRFNYGGFSANADFYLKFNLLDGSTGASQNVSIPYVVNPSGKRKGTIRFKAGSDLSSSVN